jgi:transcriptional regulator
MGTRKEEPLDLIRGTLDLLILKSLVWGPLHGYAIVKRIRDTTADVLLVEEGALYPALHRLEAQELIEAEWGVSDNNRRAKFYELTRMGRRALAENTRTWEKYAGAVAKLLAAEGPAS